MIKWKKVSWDGIYMLKTLVRNVESIIDEGGTKQNIKQYNNKYFKNSKFEICSLNTYNKFIFSYFWILNWL